MKGTHQAEIYFCQNVDEIVPYYEHLVGQVKRTKSQIIKNLYM